MLILCAHVILASMLFVIYYWQLSVAQGSFIGPLLLIVNNISAVLTFIIVYCFSRKLSFMTILFIFDWLLSTLIYIVNFRIKLQLLAIMLAILRA